MRGTKNGKKLNALAALALLLVSASALAQPAPDSSDYVFAPSTNPPLTVYTYVPRNATAESRVVFALHGLLRKGADVRDAWIASADRYGFIVVTPQFDNVAYKGSVNYNVGRVVTGGQLNAAASWSFQVIEEVFDDVRQRLGTSARVYTLFGHSAGAQFVHRFAQLMPASRAERYIAANSGWYTWMDSSVRYPWGLGGVELKPADECRAFARPLTLLLGELDTDPNHDQLNRDAASMKQGAHRLERGQNFFAASQVRARQLDCAFNWRLRTVPGVGHEFEKMGAATAALAFAPN